MVISGTGDRQEITARDIAIGIVKVRCVEQVGSIRSELHLQPLQRSKAAEQAEIEIHRTGLATSAPKESTLEAETIAKIVGHSGEKSGPVYKITVGRDDLGVKEMDATINSRMGLNTWAAFVGSNEDAAVAGDIAMLESEVQPVLKALRAHGLNVVAIVN